MQHGSTFRIRDFHPLWLAFPGASAFQLILNLHHISARLAPGDSVCPVPLSFAVLTESRCFLLLRVLSYFNSPRAHASLFMTHYSAIHGSKADLRLPMAYRSLPRPSSLSEPSHPLGGLNSKLASPQINPRSGDLMFFHGLDDREHMLYRMYFIKQKLALRT